jgi:hypothetical protein
MNNCQIGLAAIAAIMSHWPPSAVALPPPEEVPEEVLRTEIILEARSPLTGEPLTAAEYAVLLEELRSDRDPILPSQIRQAIFLLQLRRALKPVIPILP